MYIVDISVPPKFRKLGLGKLMMQSMYQVVVQLRLERMLGGAACLDTVKQLKIYHHWNIYKR
ncbi:hypothetical protein NCCP133_16180 [Cytobacillus sp. NCCP-133]|nr:hypothetical protein NCCP133_16180 [Cytobacillus sp. NCCP-133]